MQLSRGKKRKQPSLPGKDDEGPTRKEMDLPKESSVNATEDKFDPITEIEFKFLLRDSETVSEGLTKFIKTSEAHNDGFPCTDIVSKYLRSSPNCEELFSLLEREDNPLKPSGVSLVFRCLEQILTRIRVNVPKSLSAGETIAQKVMVMHMRKVYSCLQAQNKSNIIKSTLQLLISIVMLSEKLKKTVQTRLNFQHVHFPALFKRRNRKDAQDVRSCMVLLTLAFLLDSDNSTVIFMVQQKTFLQMTILGLKFDAKEIVVDVLSTLLDKVVKNTSVTKTDKVKLFSEVMLRHLGDLYNWLGPEAWSAGGTSKHSQDADSAPVSSSAPVEVVAHIADIVDSFLQELCCNTKHGISFCDKSIGLGNRNLNQLLSHFIKWLIKGLKEPRKAELMVGILAATPDLIQGVLIEMQPSLVPRWSDSWAHHLDWLILLFNALPSIPPFISDKNWKGRNDQTNVAMAAIFCTPPLKAASTLSQSLKNEDIRVRHSYLELMQVMCKKACSIHSALLTSAIDQGFPKEKRENLSDLFTAIVMKSLPPVSQLFVCVDKAVAISTVGSMGGKQAVMAIEQRLSIDVGEHLCLLLRVLSLYQKLSPIMMAQRSKDITRLVQTVGKQLIQADNSKDDDTADEDSKSKESLPHFYLLKMLSETDAKSLSLGKEGMLEELLLLAKHNMQYLEVTVGLICKMLESMDVFSGHKEELTIWLRLALNTSVISCTDVTLEEDQTTSKLSPSKEKKSIPDTKSSKSGCLHFAARCLGILVNNPTPYTDRVIEAMSDCHYTTNFEMDMHDAHASISTNEFSKEAILLMEEGKLEKLVRASCKSTTSSSTSRNDTMISNAKSDLLVTPLILVALDQLEQNEYVEMDAQKYVCKVLLELMHGLPQPMALVHLIERSGMAQKLDTQLHYYLQSWLPSHSTPSEIAIDKSLCTQFFYDLLCLRQEERKASQSLKTPRSNEKVQQRLKLEVNMMTQTELLSGLGQITLYLGEALSDSKSVSGKIVHIYRVAAESLISSLMEQEGKSSPIKYKQLSETLKTSQKAGTTDEEPEILSLLKSEESIVYCAVKQLLFSPQLWQALRLRKIAAVSMKKTDQVEETAVVENKFIIFEVLSLIESTLGKCSQCPWFCKDTEIIKKHFDLVVNFLKVQGQSLQKAAKSKKKMKKSGGTPGADVPLTQCCVSILELLYPSLSLAHLSHCIEAMINSYQPAQLMDDHDLSKLTGLGQLLVKMLNHWADLISQELGQGDLKLIVEDRSYWKGEQGSNRDKITFPKSQHTNNEYFGVLSASDTISRDKEYFKIKITPTFQDLCGSLEPEAFKSFFDMMLQVQSQPVQGCLEKLLLGVPILVDVLCNCELFKQPTVEKISSVGHRVASLLIRKNENIFKCVDSWLKGGYKKTSGGKDLWLQLSQGNLWWLLRVYIETLKKLHGASNEMVSALQKNLISSLDGETLTLVNEDGLVALKLLSVCACEDDTYEFQEALFTAISAFIKGKPKSLTKHHYDLLLTCAGSHNYWPKLHTDKRSGPKASDGCLNLMLTNLCDVLSEKERDTTWVDYLLTESLKIVSKLDKSDASFLLSYWGSFVKTTLKHLYKDSSLLELLSLLVPRVYSQPQDQVELSASTLFEMCLSHTAFFPVMMTNELPDAKAGVVKLLYTLGSIEPSCYQKPLRKVLVGAYGATLSQTDQYLLQMIVSTTEDSAKKFECPLLWGQRAVEKHSVTQALGSTLHKETSVADVLNQLNAQLLHQSMLHFPLRRCLTGQEIIRAKDYKSKPECYDPKFLLRLFAQILTPDKHVPLHQFVEKGCLGYLLIALSSHVLACRLLAYQALNDFHLHAQGSRWAERSEVSFLLDLLNASRSQDGQKLSFVVALFYARVARLLLFPADPLYMPVMRFLVARPEMDLRNVPEFYKLFFSPGSNFKQERNWCLSLLADGLKETSDYWLYQKKSIFKITQSFYCTAVSDSKSRALVLSIIKAACREKTVAVHMVKNHGLLSWLGSATKSLNHQPEHFELLSEIAHTLWHSLSSYQHLRESDSGKTAADELSDDDSEEDNINKNNVEKEKTEMDEGDTSSSDDEDDNDDEESNNRESSDDSSNDDSDHSEASLKRKKTQKGMGSKRQKLSEGSYALRSNNTQTEKDIDDNCMSLTFDNSQKKRIGKTGSSYGQPSVPKSTIVELGQIVKNLIWQLRTSSLTDVGRLLEAIEWLAKPNVLPQTSSPSHKTTGRTRQFMTEEKSEESNQLFSLTDIESCLILHRLATAAESDSLVKAVEKLMDQENLSQDFKQIVDGESWGKKADTKVGGQAGDDEPIEDAGDGENEDVEKVGSNVRDRVVEDLSEQLVTGSDDTVGKSVNEKSQNIEKARELITLLKKITESAGFVKFV